MTPFDSMRWEHGGILLALVLVWKAIRGHLKRIEAKFNGHKITYEDKEGE